MPRNIKLWTPSKKTPSKKAVSKTHKKSVSKTRKTTAARKVVRRKTHVPKIMAHGKTAAQRGKYIEYLGAKKKLIKVYFG